MLLVGLARVTTPWGHRKAGTWAGGCGDGGPPLLAALQGWVHLGELYGAREAAATGSIPGTAVAARAAEAGAGPGTQMPSGAEPVVMCVSVCLCTCACLCLCAQPTKVTVRERCQQPRNGLGMESMSQIGTQGRPEASRSSPSVVTVSICATAGVGPDEMSPPGAGQGACPGGFGQDRGQGVPGGATQVRGAWL